jgi:hypothetical protein
MGKEKAAHRCGRECRVLTGRISSKDMAGMKCVAVKIKPQEKWSGGKRASNPQEISIYNSGLLFLTHRSRPPSRWHNEKRVIYWL